MSLDLERWIVRAERDIEGAVTQLDLASRSMYWSAFFRGVLVGACSVEACALVRSADARIDASVEAKRLFVGRLA